MRQSWRGIGRGCGMCRKGRVGMSEEVGGEEEVMGIRREGGRSRGGAW